MDITGNRTELRQLGEHTYVIKSSTNVGIYLLDDSKVVLIDSGEDGFGQVIDRVLTERGWTPSCIVNTHAHIDHIGGNEYLMKKYDIPAYMTPFEIAFASYPDLEINCMNGGTPTEILRDMFKRPCNPGYQSISNMNCDGLNYVDLPGHSAAMVGIGTDDGVWFLGDAYLSLGYLTRHRFSYIYNVAEYAQSLLTVAGLAGTCFVPGHGRIEHRIGETIESNIDNLQVLEKMIIEFCSGWTSFDNILKYMNEQLQVPEEEGYYTLLSSTLRSFLACLQQKHELNSQFMDHLLMWCKK